MKRSSLLILALGFLLAPALALSQTTQTAEGINGDRDKVRRGPVLTVSRIVSTENVKLLVDAHVPHPEMQGYPIRFDFYVNRHLVTSQMRSPQLPGAIGITVSPEQASLPFNYSVVATLLHPNRSFSTVINGAAFSNELSSLVNCSMEITLESFNSYSAEGVSTTQNSNNSFTLSFNASSGDDQTIGIAAVISTNGETATSLVEISKQGTSTLKETNGSFKTDENGLSNISLSASDESFVMTCRR